MNPRFIGTRTQARSKGTSTRIQLPRQLKQDQQCRLSVPTSHLSQPQRRTVCSYTTQASVKIHGGMRTSSIIFKNDEAVSRSGNILYLFERLNLMHGSSRTLPTLARASIPSSTRPGIFVHDNARFLSTSASTLIAPDLESDTTPSTLSSATFTSKTTSPSSTLPILDLITAKESTPVSDFQSLFPDIPASFVDSSTRDPFSTPRSKAPWRNYSMREGSEIEEALRKSVYQRDPIGNWWPIYAQAAAQWRRGIQQGQLETSCAMIRTDFIRFIGALKVAPASSHTSNRLKKLKRLFDEFHRVIHTPSSNAKVYNAFLETLHFWKMYDLIPEWTQRIKSKIMTPLLLTEDPAFLKRENVQARYHELMRVLADANQVEEMIKCLEELKASRSDTLQPTANMYHCLLETFMKHKDISSAMRTFQEMREQGIEPQLTTFNILMRGHLENKDSQATQSVLESLLLTGIRPDIFTFNLLMSGYLNMGEIERVNGFYKGLGEYGLTPNSKTYRILMKTHMRQGQVDQVLDMFCRLSESHQRKLQPGSEDYRVLIQTLASHGRMPDALRVLRELTVSGKVPVTTTIYNVFIIQYAREGQVEKARKVLNRIIAEKLPLVNGSINPLIQAYLAQEDYDKVGEMTELMYRYGIEPSTATFNIMIDSTKSSGNLDRAMKLFEQMAIEGIEPDVWTYNSLLALYVHKLLPVHDKVRWKGDTAAVTREQIEEYVPRIEKLLQQMKVKGIKPDIVTYTNLIHQYVILRDVEQAEMLFHEMVKSGISPNAYAFNTLMNGFVQIEEMDKAVELFRRMPKYGVQPNATTFTTLIKGYANIKQLTLAANFATSLQHRSSKIPMDQYSLHTLMQLAQKSQQPRMALDIFEMMRGRGMEPDSFTLTILLNSLSRDYSISFSKTKSGSKSYDQREEDPGAVRDGNSTIEAVESILEVIQRNGYRLHHAEITTMISAYFRLGRPLAAIEFFKASLWQGNPKLNTTNCGAFFNGLLAPELDGHYDGVVLNLYTRMLSRTREVIQAEDEQRRQLSSTEVNSSSTKGTSWPATSLPRQSGVKRSASHVAPHQFPELDLVTINILFQAFSKRQNWTIVLQLWRDLESIGADKMYPFEMPLEFLGWAAQAYHLTPDQPEDLATHPSLSNHDSVGEQSSRKPHQQQERELHSEMARKLLWRLWDAHRWMGVEWSVKVYGYNIFESQMPTLFTTGSLTGSASKGSVYRGATNHRPSRQVSPLIARETSRTRYRRGEIEDKRAQDEQQQRKALASSSTKLNLKHTPAMRHSLLTENLSPMMPSDQFAMLHHSQQPNNAAAAAAASLTSELIHASLVAATHSTQNAPRTTAARSSISTCGLSLSNTTAANSKSPETTTHLPPKKRRSTACVSAPKISANSLATLEYSVHVSPKRMTRDLVTIFPGVDLSNLLVVPTVQKCNNDMVAWDAAIAKEKDDRLDDFVRWSTELHHRLEKLGYWSDMTDPASGFPMFGERGRDVYPDVEGCELLLKYDYQNTGCCKVLLHPTWGSKIYPATFFTTAPLDVLTVVIEQVEQEYRLPESDP
ncbi:hypothetical protein BG011_008691 [Mortierella polycephala]|uniref:Pentacotripeptide-repeat region of PRORP domain-containing protein n=1 Tax=Mortierella polycephala TaxID=41804 RepID=A0A9P6QBI6_9FUNG|nr:hypothetical protein BG011_008691 [Mortierella polycephala]